MFATTVTVPMRMMKMKMTTVAKLSSRERRRRRGRGRRRRRNNRSSNEESSSHVNHVACSLFTIAVTACSLLPSLFFLFLFFFVRRWKNGGSSRNEKWEKNKSQKFLVERERERELLPLSCLLCLYHFSEYTERFSRIDDAYTEPNAKCRRR
jgi:hypothetical protein